VQDFLLPGSVLCAFLRPRSEQCITVSYGFKSRYSARQQEDGPPMQVTRTSATIGDKHSPDHTQQRTGLSTMSL
jgi:hypothetical protein